MEQGSASILLMQLWLFLEWLVYITKILSDGSQSHHISMSNIEISSHMYIQTLDSLHDEYAKTLLEHIKLLTIRINDDTKSSSHEININENL